jgi:NADPH-dependent ferric siderophore reductase
MAARLIDRLFLHGELASVASAGGRMRHLRLTGPALRGLAWRPGQQVRVNVEPDRLMPVLRTYSIWDCTDEGLDLYVLDHGDGPGSSWARDAKPGDEVSLTKPQGDFVNRPGGYHLFVGEETAAVAFGAMLRALPDSEPAYGVVEVDQPADRLPLARELSWHYRDGRAAASSASMVAAVRDLNLPGEPGVGYVAGEARTVQAVRAHLVNERGWPRRSVLTKPFWTPGRKGME